MNTQEMLKQIEAAFRKSPTTQPDREQPVSAGQDTVCPAPIAIIGLSGCFPNSATVHDFWKALDNDECLLSEIPASRFDWQAYYDPDAQDRLKSHTRWGGFIPDIRGFDAGFFRMLPQEARLLDPRQRLLLMSVYHTLEDAGYAPQSLAKTRTGVFVGAEENEYVKSAAWDKNQSEGIGNAPSMLANQLSYFFDWRGPNEYLNTMCSGGAVAIHRAVASLRCGESTQAIVGVANLLLRPDPFIALSAMGQMSHTPVIHSFGEAAQGYLPAEGVASILLKPLAQAEADGDAIYAVLKHTAVNFNGQGGMSIASPNIAAHTDLILQCYREAGIDPADLTYIEAQGMASPVTDIAEWTAFNRALQTLAQEQTVSLAEGHCKVSTLKPTLGHMQSASAFGALFRVIRNLQTNKLHGIYSFEQSAQDLETHAQPCQLLTSTQVWPQTNKPRLAGLHSYGSGGNNAHLLIEEYVSPDRDNAISSVAAQIMPFSAETEQQCRTQVNNLVTFMKENPDCPLPDVAYTLQFGRDALKQRVAFIASDTTEWLQQATHWLAADAHCDDTDYRIYSNARQHDSKTCPTAPDITADADLQILHTLAQSWVSGQTIEWPLTKEQQPVRRHLPVYPFARKAFWLESSASADAIPITMNTDDNDDKETTMTVTSGIAATTKTASAGEKAAELFTFCADSSDKDFHEDYLTFCPFPERIPGFSMTRVFLNPKEYRKEMTLIQRKQIEMRQVLFFKEDFTQINHLLDIGCGHGTDVIQIANHHPHIHTDGFTITKAQADLGNYRIVQKELQGRARIFNHDSSKVKFPRDDYDVIIGLEVSCLIPDKDGVFSNISSSLKNHGRVLLMDFIANLHGAIEDPSIDIYIPTKEQWARNLAKYNLVIDEVVDVSPQIANFQHDPDHEENIKDCPKVVQDSWRNYANNAVAIDRGWLSYVLFRIRKDLYSDQSDLKARNMAKLQAQKPYPLALEEMQNIGHVPYPILDESLLANAYPDERYSDAGRATKAPGPLSDTKLVGAKLFQLFEDTLSLSAKDIQQAETFRDLGISSINSVELLQAINGAFSLKLPTSLIFEYNTMDDLARYLTGHLKTHKSEQLEQLREGHTITASDTTLPVAMDSLTIKLAMLFASELDIPQDKLLAAESFSALGLTSINSVELMQALNTEFGLTLPTSVIFECNSLDALADHLKKSGVSAAAEGNTGQKKLKRALSAV